MSQGSYTLSYFNVPGRGEIIRVMLAIGGIKFENNFIPLPLPIVPVLFFLSKRVFLTIDPLPEE